MKNPSEALEKQKEKASAVKEGLKDAYGEGQVNAAVKANTTTEKEKLNSNGNSLDENNSEEGKNGQLPKTDPEQYRYKSNTNPENEKRISDLPKRNQELQTDDDSIDLPNDNGIEVGSGKSTKFDLPKTQNLPTKDSRLNQFNENDQSFVHQSTADNVQMKPSRLPENGNLTTVSYNLTESAETGNVSAQNIVTKEAAPKPINKVHTGYKPANVAFTAPTKINVTRETKNRNNELKEQLLKNIK